MSWQLDLCISKWLIKNQCHTWVIKLYIKEANTQINDLVLQKKVKIK